MSADNWRICPKCLAHAIEKRNAAIHKATKAANEAYGKVSAVEFMKLDRVVKELELSTLPDAETFREDYNIGTYEDGRFTVDYCGECQERDCNFKVNFKHSEQKTV